jgi:predicted GNAT family acetyltransferase
MAEPSDVRIVDNPDEQRFEAHLSDELVGVVEYVPEPDKLVVMHTEVFEGFEGQGIGGRLLGGMLDQLREQGRRIESRCPYTSSFLRKHPEYADLVVDS